MTERHQRENICIEQSQLEIYGGSSSATAADFFKSLLNPNLPFLTGG
jgi:hypothetical protein